MPSDRAPELVHQDAGTYPELVKTPDRIEAEGKATPAGLIPPDILPKPADLHTHIERLLLSHSSRAIAAP